MACWSSLASPAVRIDHASLVLLNNHVNASSARSWGFDNESLAKVVQSMPRAADHLPAAAMPTAAAPLSDEL
jgi:hypothetical protein